MISTAQKFFNGFARYVQKPTLALIAHQPTLNKVFEVVSLSAKSVPGTRQDWHLMPNFRIRQMRTPTSDQNLLLYFHGGGFTIGSSLTHRWLAAHLGHKIGAQIWVPDYRLAPRHPYPAGPTDCFETYREALKTTPPERIVIAGDSAGGCLVLNTVTRIAAAGLPQPAAIGLLSPVTDLAHRNASHHSFRDTDMLLPAKWIDRALTAYLDGHDPLDPQISPQDADLSFAPPAFIQVAEGEMLYDDAILTAKQLPQAELDIWQDVPHVWQLGVGRSPEANEAVARMTEFFNAHLP